MKPNRIIMLRHAESEGNVNKEIYTTKPDYALNLTDLGKQQSNEAGRKLYGLLGDESCISYVSPFYRTRQTYDCIKPHLNICYEFKEDPRLREQEWCGKLRSEGFDFCEISIGNAEARRMWWESGIINCDTKERANEL